MARKLNDEAQVLPFQHFPLAWDIDMPKQDEFRKRGGGGGNTKRPTLHFIVEYVQKGQKP